jgi:hypothetical protein
MFLWLLLASLEFLHHKAQPSCYGARYSMLQFISCPCTPGISITTCSNTCIIDS